MNIIGDTIRMIKKLSETELKIMDKIWEHTEGLESDAIYSCFQDDYAVSTIGTILRRILQKGWARSERKGLHHIFIPVITKEEYKKIVTEQEVSKIADKISGLIASFYGKEKLSEVQSEQLKNMLKEMKDD